MGNAWVRVEGYSGQMIYPVILSGGSGTRLWPMSRSLYPKQLLALFGDTSLLQQTVRRVTGHAIPAREVARRPGDPAVLVASSDKIKRELHWHPRFTSLESIVSSAWEWRRAHPDGYGS